jgi:hypothetical protein
VQTSQADLRVCRSSVLANRSTFPFSNSSFQNPDSSAGASTSMRIGMAPTLEKDPTTSIVARAIKNRKSDTPMAGVVNAKRRPDVTKTTATPMASSSPRESSGMTM